MRPHVPQVSHDVLLQASLVVEVDALAVGLGAFPAAKTKDAGRTNEEEKKTSQHFYFTLSPSAFRVQREGEWVNGSVWGREREKKLRERPTRAGFAAHLQYL